jgi:predicted nucleic acid-binding protein
MAVATDPALVQAQRKYLEQGEAEEAARRKSKAALVQWEAERAAQKARRPPMGFMGVVGAVLVANVATAAIAWIVYVLVR